MTKIVSWEEILSIDVTLDNVLHLFVPVCNTEVGYMNVGITCCTLDFLEQSCAGILVCSCLAVFLSQILEYVILQKSDVDNLIIGTNL